MLRFLFLGPAQITREDQVIELGVAKAVALLAYLAATGTPQRREHLIDLLWPESLPDAGRKNLRNTLWVIRQACDDAALQTDADTIRLSDAVWVDLCAFEAAIQASARIETGDASDLQRTIDLFRGPLLDGLSLSEAPDFELWLTGERERLGQLYLRALESLAGVHRAAGRWSEMISVARRALAYDNLQEPVYRALMEAHARLGDRSEALRQYDRLRAILARELGVEPLPETESLRTAIINGDLRPTVPIPSAPLPRSRQPSEADRQRLPFVGRQAECVALDQELALTAMGQARVVLITGELGIGKSRLWREWSAAQPPRPGMLETRCLDTTQALPFAPLVGLFSRQSCFERLFKPPSPLSPVWLAELARLLPGIRQHWPDMPAPAALPPDEERHRLFEAFVQTLRALENRPIVLFIDDLHSADHATLDWLLYLVDRMRDEPLLLAVAYRPSDAPAQLINLAAAWSREGVVRQLPLDRLTLEESRELIAALGGDTDQVERLQLMSAGNPYFLIELSRAEPGDLPPHLAELVRARLNRLPDAAHQVLQAAAVLEGEFDFAALRRTSGRGEEETLDALDVLLDAAVLVERRGSYEFVHPLVAGIVRDDLGIARRSFLHHRAAKALEATHGARLSAIAGQLAGHYAQAGRIAQAARYAEMAAQHAQELTAPAEAVAFYRQALALEPTPARRMELGRALYLQGDLENARATLCEALNELEAAGDRTGAIQACLAMAESYLPSGRGESVIHWVNRALSDFGAQFGPEALARAYYLLGAGQVQAGGSLEEAGTHLEKAASLSDENNLLEMSARSRFELGNLLAQQGDLAGALGAFEKTLVLAQVVGARFLEILGHNNLAYHAHLAGDLDTAREHIQAGLALAEAHGLFIPRQYLYSTRGEIALAEGQPDEAEGWFRRGLEEAEKNNNRLQAANIRANLGLAARARGDLDEALVLLDEAQRAAAAISAPHLQTQIDLWLAELYLQRGERAAAREALARAEGRLAGSERRGLRSWAERVRAKLEG